MKTAHQKRPRHELGRFGWVVQPELVTLGALRKQVDDDRSKGAGRNRRSADDPELCSFFILSDLICHLRTESSNSALFFPSTSSKSPPSFHLSFFPSILVGIHRSSFFFLLSPLPSQLSPNQIPQTRTGATRAHTVPAERMV